VVACVADFGGVDDAGTGRPLVILVLDGAGIAPTVIVGARLSAAVVGCALMGLPDVVGTAGGFGGDARFLVAVAVVAAFGGCSMMGFAGIVGAAG
jgi:hypothetical protein